jgi:hypothetical protein
VPKRLEHATAEFLGNGKLRQTFLKRTLGTKDLREANVRAKPILIEFDRILAQAEALTVQRPMLTREELLTKVGAARARWAPPRRHAAPKAHCLAPRRRVTLYGLTVIGKAFCLQRRLEPRFYIARY